ncbi:hypothetical protein GQ44DRAFT_731099 [Phaeosphaeriaceae sp. PMI808]|nr:hypothetical protein GQ44DRAFT_731099 [Phaeosphaeriaceae sp. PMI808]
MPLELHPVTPADTVSWIRIRALAYYGPTHDALHNGPICESSIRGAAEDRKIDLEKPNTWHWKIVDTELSPRDDDPSDNGGRTIAISAWSMHNLPEDVIDAFTTNPSLTKPDDDKPRFLPPELRMDALSSLFGPLRAAEDEVMGTSHQYLKLNTLATHPEHQGRGAGSMLLKWGIKKADDEGLIAYLDATSKARPMYEKQGFEIAKVIEWDRVPWGGEGMDCHWSMVRQPRTLK